MCSKYVNFPLAFTAYLFPYRNAHYVSFIPPSVKTQPGPNFQKNFSKLILNETVNAKIPGVLSEVAKKEAADGWVDMGNILRRQ